jgi:hypothetical protein
MMHLAAPKKNSCLKRVVQLDAKASERKGMRVRRSRKAAVERRWRRVHIESKTRTKTRAGDRKIDFVRISQKAPSGRFTRRLLNLNSHNHNQRGRRPGFSLALQIERSTSTLRHDISLSRTFASHVGQGERAAGTRADAAIRCQAATTVQSQEARTEAATQGQDRKEAHSAAAFPGGAATAIWLVQEQHMVGRLTSAPAER